MTRPQHQTTVKIAADAKADDLGSYIKQLRMAVNAGNVARTRKVTDAIQDMMLRAEASDATVQAHVLATNIGCLADEGINEPRRRCLNVLVGALENMAELL